MTIYGRREAEDTDVKNLGQTATPAPQPGQQLPYEIVIHQTPAYVTSIYIGNLPPNVSRKYTRGRVFRIDYLFNACIIRNRISSTFPKIWLRSRSQASS